MIHVTYVNESFHICEFVKGDEDDDDEFVDVDKVHESCHLYE